MFEENTFHRMLVLLTFPQYKPDRGVRTFNATRFKKLDLGEPSYTNQISAPASQQKRRVFGSDTPRSEKPWCGKKLGIKKVNVRWELP